MPSEQRYEALAANAQLPGPIDTRPANISLAKILIVAHPCLIAMIQCLLEAAFQMQTPFNGNRPSSYPSRMGSHAVQDI